MNTFIEIFRLLHDLHCNHINQSLIEFFIKESSIGMDGLYKIYCHYDDQHNDHTRNMEVYNNIKIFIDTPIN